MKAEIKGIKCDNPNCDYKDISVKWDDIEKTGAEYLNKPCPKCGQSLLTQEDFDSTKRLIFVMTELEKIAEEVFTDNNDNPINFTVKSDGTEKKSLHTDKLNINISSEQLIMQEKILKQPMGKDLIKNMFISQNN